MLIQILAVLALFAIGLFLLFEMVRFWGPAPAQPPPDPREKHFDRWLFFWSASVFVVPLLLIAVFEWLGI